MENQNVMVVYSWTAKEGKSEELKAIYTQVTEQMNTNEPGALKVQCFFDESASRLIVSPGYNGCRAFWELTANCNSR